MTSKNILSSFKLHLLMLI